MAALGLGQLIQKIIALDWDIRVAQGVAEDERNRWRQQALEKAERDRFDLALAGIATALGL